MSVTALAFLAIYVGGLLAAFRWPVVGLGVYLWTFYNLPQARWWGQDLPDLRWSLAAALVTLAATFFTTPEEAERQPSPSGDSTEHRHAFTAHGNWGGRLLLLFAIWVWVESLWAVGSDAHFEGSILFTKYLVLFFLITRLIRTERDLEFFAWTHVIGAFTWGWVGFTSSVRGRWEPVFGSGMDDSNLIGFHLVTAIAFAGFMFLCSRGWRRFVALGALPFLLNGVILTASRSALLSLAVAGLVALLLAPRGRRKLLVLCIPLAAVLFLRLAGSEVFWERAGTIGETDVAEMDNSAAYRVEIAHANWQMFLDYPLGAGYRANALLSPQYIRAEVLGANGLRSAHNTELALLVDTGLPGTILFLTFVGWGLWSIWRMNQIDTRCLSATLGGYRAAVAASIAAYVVSGQFINVLNAEVIIWLVALVPVIRQLAGSAALTPIAETSAADDWLQPQREYAAPY